MSGIVGSRLNIRGSGLVGSIGTDGQALTSSGAGAGMVFEDSAGFDVSSITGATELTVNPADDDEFVFSDGGTLKSINFQRLQSTNAACRMNFSPSGCVYDIDNTTCTTSALGGNWTAGGNAVASSGNAAWSQDVDETMDDTTNGRIYVRTEGMYTGHVQLLWTGNTTGFRSSRFRDDTGWILGWTDFNSEKTYRGLGQYVSANMDTTPEEAGDYFYFELYQDSGGALALKGNGNPDRTAFTIWRTG